MGVVPLVPAEAAACPRAGVADADAAGEDDEWRGCARDEEEARVGDEVEPVVVAGESEGLAQFAGARAEVGVPWVGKAVGGPVTAHDVEPVGGFEGAYEDGDRFVGLAADDIEAEVHAVGEVDVGGAGGSVHGLVAWRAASGETVAAAVVDAEVGLDLDDASGEACAVGEDADEGGTEEARGEEVWREGEGVAGEAGGRGFRTMMCRFPVARVIAVRHTRGAPGAGG
jgi:hypothetical protein